MNIKFQEGYISKKGTPTFRYTVHGTAKELAEYKTVQGDNYRENAELKEIYFFGIRRYVDNTPLQLRKDGKKFFAVTELLESVVENKVNNYKAMAHIMQTTPQQLLQRMLFADDSI
jgi:hypothetical protein